MTCACGWKIIFKDLTVFTTTYEGDNLTYCPKCGVYINLLNMTNKNIYPVVTLLRTLPVEALKNQSTVEALIRCFGLVYDPSEPFGDDNKYVAGDRQTTGIYQIPGQMAPALIWLSDKGIEAYLEIGTFQGGAFAFTNEYLQRFAPDIFIGKAVDINGQFVNTDIAAYLNLEIGTSKDHIGCEYDLVMIDADHQYESVKEDFENVGKYARYCMFHDVNDNTGAEQFWKEICEKYEHVEFKFHSHGLKVQGIGILDLTKVLSRSRPTVRKK